MSTVIGAMEAYLKLNIQDFEKNLEAAKKQVESISSGFDALTSVGKKITGVGASLTVGLTTPIVALGTACVKTTADFDAAMSKVSAISGATGEDLQALRDKAKEMGEKTKFSATESAQAFTYMAMAGWDTSQMLDGIAGVMNLAAADGLDLATTSDIVTDALTAFGLQAKDSGHFADVLAKASSAANTNVSMLGQSFKYVAPVAGALGYSAEDTAIALGLMANAGIKSGQAGTAMRAAITRMVKPTEDAAMIMERYGLSLTDANGSMKSFREVMKMLRENMGQLTEAEQAKAAATLFGQEAMSGMLAIINASESDFNKLTNAIDNADGTAGQMADTMNDNLSGQLTLLKSQLEGVAIQVGEMLVPHIRTLLTQFSKWITKMSDLFKNHGELIIKIAALVACLGPVLTVVGKVISIVGTLGSVFSNLKAVITAAGGAGKILSAALTACTGPVAIVIAIIAVLVAAFVTLWKTNSDFREKITGIWNGIVEMFKNFFADITESINSLGFDFENFGEVLKALWMGLCEFLEPIFVGVFQGLSDTCKLFFDTILATVKFFVAIFKGDWSGAWDAVKQFFVANWTFIVDFFKNVGTILMGVLDVVLGWFGTSWNEVWTSIKNFFIGIWNSIVSFFQGIANWFVEVGTSIATFFVNIWTSIKTTVSNIVSGFVAFINQHFGGLFTSISNVFTGIKDFFTNIWTVIKNVFGGIVLAICNLVTGNFDGLKKDTSNVMNNIKTALANIWNSIKTVFTNALNAIKQFWTGIWTSIKDIGTAAWTAVKSGVTTAFNNVKDAISNAMNSAKTAVLTAWNNMKSGASTALSNLKATVKSGIDNAVACIKSLPSQALTWGKDMIDGFKKGIKNAISGLISTIEGLAEKVRSFLHFSRPDVGPLRDYETWMPDMVYGLSKTLQSAAPGLVDKVKALSADMADALNGSTYQVALAGAGADIRAGGNAVAEKNYSALNNSTKPTVTEKTEITIQKIEVRNDRDLEMVTQGLYNKQDQNLRALGRRNV